MDGELVNAAIMNPHIRDNFDAMGPHLTAHKISDESVVASTTPPEMMTRVLFTVAASETWGDSHRLRCSIVTGSRWHEEFIVASEQEIAVF